MVLSFCSLIHRFILQIHGLGLAVEPAASSNQSSMGARLVYTYSPGVRVLAVCVCVCHLSCACSTYASL